MEIEVAAISDGGGYLGGGGESGGDQRDEEEKGVVLSGSRDKEGSMFLVWEDLTVVLPNFGNNAPCKKLLNGLSGYAEPGRIMAIMGPSGSGKSTLLDSLAGRLPANLAMTGNVVLNGQKRRLAYGIVAYVTQEDTLLGTLTVKETLTYSASLRLPSSMTKEEVNAIVEGTIMEMGLQDCADRMIGNWHLRGISGGEKKRLSIALEILTRPRLLFLDEPTSGLDSASAYFVVLALQNITRDGCRTVISSIHQPSSQVFALFDDLFLLSGGETVYFGEANMAIKFFAEAGFPCPCRRNPSDHFLRCINSDFDNIKDVLMGSCRIPDRQSFDPLMNLATAKIKEMLVQKYKCSEYAEGAKTRLQEISTMEGLVIETKGGSEARWWKQLTVLTQRSFTNMSRDVGYYWLRIAIYITVSICVGTVFFNVGTNYTAILARGACGGFISGFMTFMSIGGFPSFIEEMKVFHRERLNGHYGVGAFILSNFLSSVPFLALISFSSGTITYYMVKFQPGLSHFAYATLDLLSSIAVVESCMMIVASLVPNFMMGIITGAGVIGIMMMTAGFFRQLPDLPRPFWRYPISYINYQAWALQGAYKNDLIGLEFDPLVAGDPKLKGDDILKYRLGIRLDHSKWWDLAVVIIILISYRVLFFTILKFKENTSICRLFYTKRSLKLLNKKTPLNKQPAINSKRHQALHSLSSQEGLNSPIH